LRVNTAAWVRLFIWPPVLVGKSHSGVVALEDEIDVWIRRLLILGTCADFRNHGVVA
jgi:hypothetical protein